MSGGVFYVVTKNGSHSRVLFIRNIVGAEADEDRIELLLMQIKGKDITEVIASGRENLASVPAGGGAVAVAASAAGGSGAAAAPAAAESKKEEKVEEKEESDDMLSCEAKSIAVSDTVLGLLFINRYGFCHSESFHLCYFLIVPKS
ncbi:unnamed protein product [Fraxinus pennsylvanica]|uniref:60S acidic ribosomal protein P2 n=1 Tax=Fraxinus pennsylvanica TaxID=56036 RepID=A0AAD1ZFF2_9LAMI|nr:unnamed protein product [Fraxinus pennsylvanica]